MAEIKHVGRMLATNKKVIIAYRTLPGDAYNCLVVPTENLPDAYHDALINLVENSAGQASYEFAEALARSTFPDGSTMLPALHSTGRLIKVPTSAVQMTPTPQVSILLSELNQIIAEQRGVAVDQLALRDSKEGEEKTAAAELAKAAVVSASPVTEETTSLPDTPEGQAKFYRSQADKLAKEAAQYRRMAEELAPTKKKVEV